MKIIDDDEELQALQQRRYEQRDSIKEDFSKQITLTQRELKIIRGNAKKTVAELNETSNADEAIIIAEAELKKAVIEGDTLVLESTDVAKGRSEASLVEIEAKNTCDKMMASKMFEVAQLKADTISTIGQGEGQIQKVMASRRKYEHLNAKMEVLDSFKNNKNLKIFGNNEDNVLS